MLAGVPEAERPSVWSEIETELRAFEGSEGFGGPCERVSPSGSSRRGRPSGPAPARAMLRGCFQRAVRQDESVDRDDLILPPDAPPELEPAYAEDGVDLTLIRWMLSLTPDQRLRVLQERQDAIEAAAAAIPRWTSGPS